MQLIFCFVLLLPSVAISAPSLQSDNLDKASDIPYVKEVVGDKNNEKEVGDKAEDEVEKLLHSVSPDTASDMIDEEVAWLREYEREVETPDEAIDEELERLRELIIVRFWQEAELEKQKALHNELAGWEVYEVLSDIQKMALNLLAGHPSFHVDK